jgi:hypothetical protein
VDSLKLRLQHHRSLCRGPSGHQPSLMPKDVLCGTCRKSAPNARIPTYPLGRAFEALSPPFSG